MKVKPICATIVLVAIASTVFPHPMAAEAGNADRVEVDREAQLRQLAYEMLFYNLDLNAEQNPKIETLFHQTYVRLERLLSPQQLDRFHATLKDGGLKAAISEVQLSTVQEMQVRNLLQAVALQSASIFTPAQRSQIERNLQTHLDEESASSKMQY
ncbi:MAG TPA: hypothetical protein IGS17_14205 [Oscillatoriales cyanobacterium M59_W2019_021]|nr:MAG: hypothetical protein D6728_05120 [Cyanobacteria bacterium J055]HIK30450.1 hypothetical protein [Oscillatoriales cyanobacterium M4454_W2019_049]HIK52057.1 hypothetical protein [Oscillatoriales cyanobacterium M59_W2019_021]